MKNIIDKELLLNILREAIRNLYKNDIELIEYKSSERNIIATLGCYLRNDKRLSAYNIDTEYNREGADGDVKRDYDRSPNTADLLIHTRGNKREGNLLYLEAKTYFNINPNEKKQEDINTIQFCMGKYNYKYGIFICFQETNVDYVLFHEGETIAGILN